MNAGHSIKDCRSNRNCRSCNRSSHHTALCKGNNKPTSVLTTVKEETRKQVTETKQKQYSPKAKNKLASDVQLVSAATTQEAQEEPSYEVYPKWVFTATQRSEKHVSLFTCKTLVRNPENGKEVEAVVFCDEGSQISVLGETLIQNLDSVPQGRQLCCIGTLTNLRPTSEYRPVHGVQLKCNDGAYLDIPLIEWNGIPSIKTPFVHNKTGMLERYPGQLVQVSVESCQPHILIGADLLHVIKNDSFGH